MKRKDEVSRGYIIYIILAIIASVVVVLYASSTQPFTLDQWITEKRYITLEFVKILATCGIILGTQFAVAKARGQLSKLDGAAKLSSEDEMQYFLRLKRQSRLTEYFDVFLIILGGVIISFSNIYISTYAYVAMMFAVLALKYIALLIQHVVSNNE